MLTSAILKGLEERGYKVMPVLDSQLPETYKSKIAEWFRESGEIDGRILLLKKKGDWHLIYDEDLNTILVARLFEIGDRVEISVEKSIELEEIELEELKEMEREKVVKDLLEKLEIAIGVFSVLVFKIPET